MNSNQRKKLNFVILNFMIVSSCIFCFSGCSNSTSDTHLSSRSSNGKLKKSSEPIPTAKTLYAMASIFASINLPVPLAGGTSSDFMR